MKKNSLLKVLGISFLVVVVLTWLIPAGSYSSGTFTSGDYSPAGLLDLFRIPLSTLSNYAGYALYILILGGFYGVLNKTGVYAKLVSSVAKKYTKKEKTFAILTICFFAILSSVTGENFVLFILVPFFMAVLLSLGFTKLSTLVSTVGAILVGNAASTYGFDICGYLNYYFNLELSANIATKIIFFIILVFLLAMYVTKHGMLVEKPKAKRGRKSTKEEVVEEVKIDIPLLDDDNYDKKTKHSYWPLAIVSIIMVVFLGIACYNWTYGVNYTGFEELYEAIVGVEINDYPILQNILGNFSPLGYWDVTEINMILVVVTLLIGWLYNVKFSDLVDGFKKGAKEVLPVAFFIAICNVVTALILGSSSGTSIYYTISNFFLKNATKFYTVGIMGPFTVISALFVNELPYVVSYMASNITAAYTDSSVYTLLAFSMQSIYGLLMLIVPTSALLIAGLSYLKVSFKDWIKYIWKYVLEAGIVTVVILGIMSLFM